jgi:Skp family chaperone for outer membrane proteins
MVQTPAPPTLDRSDVSPPLSAAEAVQSIAPVGTSEASIQKQEPAPPSTPMESPFAAIRHDLETARGQLLKKKQELQDLKVYYQNGIEEERSKIAAKSASAGITSFRAAVRDNQVELALHSIQRRKIYLAKLDTPLNQIKAALEELLYWQRRTQLLELLSKGISGLPVSEFKQEVNRIMQRYIEESQTLSIENIQVATPELEAIWKELATKDAGSAKPSTRSAPPSQKDIDIAEEICDGNYEHLYLLTHLSDKAAACLARWSGKDLYLNELTQLTPAVAKSLAKWPGEWLSLNGIQSLPAESAKYLAQWPGKRLSLNGVTRLSKSATAYLSQWQGEQLEMVGLGSIGRWENYVTRLYLSEELRRKLEME